MTEMQSGNWRRVCKTEDIPLLEGRRVVVGGFYVALFNTEEGFYATGDICPHLGGPLSDGEVAVKTVVCPLHARKIDLASGEVLNDELPRVATFRVRVEGEYVLLDTSTLSSRLAGSKKCFAPQEQRDEVA
ncbi:nitrite reductase small subunit NirD [Rubrobacter indicoceani]|uniref:nitrite reductase small subunit NirD n=1 Tax=Rubrobacter indicoceani TaxID=2051957 RepID=UPI000E5B0F3A|nr:nitrite reductase small subunit NirD [Rubrobacter indicoceani]